MTKNDKNDMTSWTFMWFENPWVMNIPCKHRFFDQLLGCPKANIGHWRRGSFTFQMLITFFWFDLKVTKSPATRLGPKARGIRIGNLPILSVTRYPTVPLCPTWSYTSWSCATIPLCHSPQSWNYAGKTTARGSKTLFLWAV